MTATRPVLAGRRLLILGGGLWQLEYVRQARRMGIETWVTDWSSEAPARSIADHFAVIDLKDHAASLTLARRAAIDAVMTAADVGVPTAAFIAEQLQLPGQSRQLAERATNKFEMRLHADRAGIPCPRFRRVRTHDDARSAAADIGYPVIVKPVDNSSSRGVRWINRPDDIPAAIETALAASGAGEALVEEFLLGTEGSIEALVDDGRAVVLGICDKTKSALPDRFDLELRYPGNFEPHDQDALDRFAQRIASAFGVEDGILHIEFLLSAGTVYLIEFALRGCGSKVVTHLLPAMTGVDVVGALIAQAFGLKTALKPVPGPHGALHFLIFRPGVVRSVHGVDEARRVPGVIDVCVERQPGDSIGEIHDGRSRPGHVLVVGATAAEVQARIAEVRQHVRIDYDDGRGAAPLELAEVASRS